MSKKDKIPMRKVLSNDLYILKMIAKGSPVKLIHAILYTFVESLLGFFSTEYMLRYVVNGIQEKKSFEAIMTYLLCILFLNVFVFGIFSNVYKNIFDPWLSRRLDVYVNKLIFKKSLEVDLASFENPKYYEKCSKAMGNIWTCFEKVFQSIQGIISFFVQITSNIVLLIAINPVLILFAAFPLSLMFIRRRMNTLFYTIDVKNTEINRCKDYTRRSFYLSDYAKEMRLTNIYRVMLRRFKESIDKSIHVAKTDGMKLAFCGIVFHTCIQIVTILGAEAYSLYCTLVAGTMLFGDCLVVLNSIGTLSWRFSTFVSLLNGFRDVALYTNDIKQFLETEPIISENENGAVPEAGAIHLCNMSFRYDGADSYALKNLNLSINKGEKIALVGHNGAGKTTFVKLLMRLYDPTDGEILLADKNIKEYKLSSYRKMFGVVFQDYKQMSLTVAENVLGRPYRDEDEALVIESLKKAGVYDKIAELPLGIHTIMTKEFDADGVILSGGQSQKIAIAGIYANNSEVVILDEPSSALDPLAEHELYENMMKACEGKTIIMISHRLSSAVSADRILHMENGEIIEFGSHRELMAAGGKYAEMFRIQAENYVSAQNGEVRIGE